MPEGKSKSTKKDTKKYKITTNVKALSKINDFLKVINIDNIPIIDFSNKKQSESFVALMELQLSNDTEKFNDFFQTITQTEDDFTQMEAKAYHPIAMDFFDLLPTVFLNTIETSVNELKKQRDLASQKTQKAMESAAKSLIQEKLEEQGISTGNIPSS